MALKPRPFWERIAMRFCLLAALLLCCRHIGHLHAEETTPAKIKSLRRLDDTIVRLGGQGDNWHMTWLGDDRMVAGLCDGNAQPWPNVPHKSFNSRLIAIRGVPPQPEFEDVPGYPELLVGPGPRDVSRYYNFGILAVGDTIYQFLSTPDRPFDTNKRRPRFIGAKLIYSPDNGATWHNQDGSTPVRWESWEKRNQKNMAFFKEPADAFSLLTCLQMGQNYRDNTDGYAYVYSPNGNTEGTMNELVLARVPKDRIAQRSAYEFFVHRNDDGNAKWSGDIAERGPVHTFAKGWVNTAIHPYAWHPSVVYVKPLGLYLMANWGMGCADDGMWFGKPSYLGFWTAPHPWGPWTQIHEEKAWTPAGDQNARCYQPQIAPKWIAADGKSFWLVWTDYQIKDGGRPYYAFNMQRVQIDSQ
jgi:hypothetical protein